MFLLHLPELQEDSDSSKMKTVRKREHQIRLEIITSTILLVVNPGNTFLDWVLFTKFV